MDEEDIEQCRTCLNQSVNLISLAADHVVCFKVMSVLELIRSCTSVSVELNDEYPQFICLECMTKVESSYEFRIQCETAYNTFTLQKSKFDESDNVIKNQLVETDENHEDILTDDSKNLDETLYDHYEVLEDDMNPMEDEIETNDSKIQSIDIDLEILQADTGEIKCEEIEIVETFRCGICDLIFPSENSLRVHTNVSHIPTFYQCPHCPVRFISQELLEPHIRRHEVIKRDKPRKYIKQKNKPVTFNCVSCPKRFSSMPALRLHMRKHAQPETDIENNKVITVEDISLSDTERTKTPKKDRLIHAKKYRCTKCNDQFSSEENLKDHEQETHKNDEETREKSPRKNNNEHPKPSLHKMIYKCKSCDYEDITLKNTKDHLLTEHSVATDNLFNNLLYKCGDCLRDFSSIYDYFDHTVERNSDSPVCNTSGFRKRNHVCSVAGCGKTFPTPSALKAHGKSHDTHWPKTCKYCDAIVNKLPEYIQHLNENHEELKKYECKTCHKKFFTERNLKTHSGIHSGERNYMCDYCGFSFHAQNNLVSHRRIHEGIKPYKCTYCPMAFSQYAGLRSHVLNHTQERNYECTICKRKFLRHSAMKNHMKTHTGQKDYMCHVCGARFGASSSRKKHLLTHTGERNHICDFCGKAFGRKSNLNVHRKIHTGETPHVCEICGKGFIQKHVLRSHMGTHRKQSGVIANRRSVKRIKQGIIREEDEDEEILEEEEIESQETTIITEEEHDNVELSLLKDEDSVLEAEELTVLVEFPE